MKQPTSPLRRPRRHMGIETETRVFGWVFISPWIIGFLCFFAFPFIMTMLLSFDDVTEVNAVLSPQIHTIENYTHAFLYDVEFVPLLGDILQQTVISTILILVFSLIIAILLNQPMKGRAFFRAAFSFPAIIGNGLIASSVMGYSESDILNMVPTELLSYIGPEFSIIINNLMGRLVEVLMRSSVQVIIFLSGLQGISTSLYEAAHVDGATAWESFWKITLPMIMPTMFINAIYTIIDSFVSADNAMVNYLYSKSFRAFEFSYAAALSMMYIVIVLVIVGVVYALFNRRSAEVR